MKKPGFLAASMAAASASAVSASSSKSQGSREDSDSRKNSGNSSPVSSEKFAPRFDGLRFIETLVTAHR
ncbi:unnamed protein product [Ilex paraguariensis]|uniref:Uncharacterized protein n=1 Tax=Ilex paraguariensis TaxID=185542 RepID=A0ABC8TNQ2_9AQUA